MDVITYQWFNCDKSLFQMHNARAQTPVLKMDMFDATSTCIYQSKVVLLRRSTTQSMLTHTVTKSMLHARGVIISFTNDGMSNYEYYHVHM